MATLTATTILQKTLESFRTLFPYIGRMGTDFDDTPLLLNHTVTAHVRTLPSIAAYDATTGYANGATEANTLLTDIPILVDSHKHVPIKLDHLNAIADYKDAFEGSVADTAYVLGKGIIDTVLAKAKSSNLSYSSTAATADSDMDVIEALTTTMNNNGANPSGRVGLVSSAVAQTLALDSRVASKDYYGVLTGRAGLRVFRGVGGFDAIYEYPGLPSNNAASQTFTAATTDICTAAGHGFSTGDRVRVTTSAADLPAGLAVDTTYYVIKIDANTFKLATSDANATAGTAVDITDAGTGTHSIVGYENITGLFFEASAIAIRAGIPSKSDELANSMGIPRTMSMEALRDPISGFALALMKWQAAGTADLYIRPTAIWGSAVGRQAGAAGTITDKAGLLLRSA